MSVQVTFCTTSILALITFIALHIDMDKLLMCFEGTFCSSCIISLTILVVLIITFMVFVHFKQPLHLSSLFRSCHVFCYRVYLFIHLFSGIAFISILYLSHIFTTSFTKLTYIVFVLPTVMKAISVPIRVLSLGFFNRFLDG